MRTTKPTSSGKTEELSRSTNQLKQGATDVQTGIVDTRSEAAQLTGLQRRIADSQKVQNLQAIQARINAGALAQRQAAPINNASHSDALMLNSAGDTTADGEVVQRVLHQGSTTRSRVYASADDVPKKMLENYPYHEVEDFITSPKHYKWDNKAGAIVEIEEKVSKKRKRSDSSTESSGGGNSSGEFTGWMKSVDEGVKEKNKTGSLKFKFKARTIKDQGKGGFDIGINNMADIESLDTTSDIAMTDNQQGLNFFANHLMQQALYVDPEGKDKDTVTKERATKKRKLGPEIQQVIGEDKSGGLRAYYGGNLQNSQTILRDELLRSKPKKKGKFTLRNYHTDNYRKPTIALAIAQMEQIISNQSLGAEIQSMLTKGKDNKEISAFLKSKIGNKYKDERMKYLYKLRNALRAQYGKHSLEDAEIYVPDNVKEIHAESNLLEVVIKELESIFDVIGTKVPCVACFAKFCAANQQAHLLQYTSSIWFSEPCMTQLGCDYSVQSMSEVVNYLGKIDSNLKGVVGSIKQYTGHQGNIKQTFDDDDSGSEGEEARDEVIKKYTTS